MSLLSDAIMAASYRVDAHGEYIASLEVRTRYALIDPILQALGWNLSDPSYVQLEYETKDQPKPPRVDYALLSTTGKPVILVEAKPLHEEYVAIHKANRAEDRARIKKAWEILQCGDEIPNAPPIIAIWRDIMEAHETQLKEYIEQLQIGSGYAVLTYGADWRISDLAESGNRSATVNILFDSPSRCEEVLGVLRRANVLRRVGKK